MRRDVFSAIVCFVILTALPAVGRGSEEDSARRVAPGEVQEADVVRIPVEFRPMPVGGTLYTGALLADDGRVYLGISRHNQPACLVCYDPKSDKVTIVAEMTSGALRGGKGGNEPELENPVIGDESGVGLPPHSTWKHPHDKIHARLYQGRDGRIYGATDASVGNENPNNTRLYGGGHFFAYDPETGKVEDLGWARRHEGIIALCMDSERQIMYGVTWPTGLLVRCRAGWKEYYVGGRGVRTSVLGLTSSNLQSVPRYFDVLKDGRVFICDGATGDILVWIPEDYKGKLDPDVRPGNLYRPRNLTVPYRPEAAPVRYLRQSNRFRSWWMSGTLSPDGMHIYSNHQRGEGSIMEIDGTQGTFGKVIRHAQAWPDPWQKPGRAGWGPGVSVLAFGKNGLLYYRYYGDGHLRSYDPQTGEVRDWGIMTLRGEPGIRMRSAGGGMTSVADDGTMYFGAGIKRGRGTKRGLAWFNPSRLKESKLLHRGP